MTPRLMLLAAGAAALTLTACERRAQPHPEAKPGEVLKTVAKLDCPPEQGKLTLVSAAKDGRTCEYTAEGAEVTLRLVALSGMQPKAVLGPIEADLQKLIPPPVKEEPAPKPTTEAADQKGGDKAEIEFPGLHIKADDDGADIRIGSLSIDADEGGAEVRVGTETVVNANNEAAEIRTLRGGDAIRASYILASDEPADDGYRVVGYEARGPKTGPLVVAVVKARNKARDEHDLFEDIKDLVKLNVGG